MRDLSYVDVIDTRAVGGHREKSMAISMGRGEGQKEQDCEDGHC
jgi:hypothetical protein